MSEKRSLKAIKDRHTSWRAFHCRPENAEVFERQSEQMHRDIGILLRVIESRESPRRLTLPELGHLSAVLVAVRDSGEYYGPQKQYYARTERLIAWCGKQIKDCAKNGEDADDTA